AISVQVDAVYREEVVDGIEAQLRDVLAVRARYLDLLAGDRPRRRAAPATGPRQARYNTRLLHRGHASREGCTDTSAHILCGMERCSAARPTGSTRSTMPLTFTTRREAPGRAARRHFDTYLFDLDGTIYLGTDLLPGAAELVSTLRAQGARVLFVSNNPTR